MGEAASGPVAICMKWVALRPDVDALSGVVETDDRWSGASPADEAALELGLRIAAQRGVDAVVATVGPDAADAMLRNALACGATAAVRVESDDHAVPTSAAVAACLADALRPLDPALVVCGDWSLDRGSGSVPVFLATFLGLDDACGLTSVELDSAALLASRRLDGGRRERLRIEGRAVISVEGAAARLRRAPLTGVLRATTALIDVRRGVRLEHEPAAARTAPFRPRPVDNPAPAAPDPRARVIALTGALSDRTPPQRLVLEPDAAADKILQQLSAWGYELPDERVP